jgi:predicted DNA-binding transcriptional regulator YafY
MNKTDRLLAIVLELQGKGRQRAEDLAATFEISKRTIYRDIEALCEAGIPVVSIPGQGYSLMEGYFLPPLSFSADEATMLLLGSDFMAQNFDAQYRAAAQSASRKIASVLSEQHRETVRSLQKSIRFIASNANKAKDDAEIALLQQLRRAIIERITVRFTYHTRHRRSEDAHEGMREGAPTTREADPYGLIHLRDSWHLSAYCHLRNDVRIFRLDRMENLELLPHTFQRPPDFEMRPPREPDTPILVRALFDAEVARWVRESHFFFITSLEDTSDGLLVTLNARQESDVLPWLLGWGRHVRILEPASLCQKLLEEISAIQKRY